MPAARTSSKPWRRALALVAAAGLCGATWAARVNQPFTVTVNLTSGATCDSTTVGSRASVACQPVGTPPPLPALFLQIFRGGQFVGDVHSGIASGTITSWRVVRAGDRDFLEIMVAW